jgi:hypothetical protein
VGPADGRGSRVAAAGLGGVRGDGCGSIDPVLLCPVEEACHGSAALCPASRIEPRGFFYLFAFEMVGKKCGRRL